MSRQYQDPSFLSSHYQTPYPHPSEAPTENPAQSIQPQPLGQPIPITRDSSSQHAYTSSSHQEGSLQPQPSGRRQSNHSPYAAFPEPGSPPGHQTYPTHSETASNFSGSTHRRDHQGQYDYLSPFSESSQFDPSGGSNTGAGNNRYPYPGGYNATQATQPQDAGYAEEHDRWQRPGNTPRGYNATQPQDARNLEEHNYRPPHGNTPVSVPRPPPCRFPRCNKPAFFDRRINELREWCSDEHMREALSHRVEKPCRTCGQWPRRNGYKYCSGNYCRYSR